MKIKIFLSVLILTSVFCVAGTALAMTEQERQALIAQIQAQIDQLMIQIQQLQGQGQTGAWCHTFNSTLQLGDTGLEVAALQTAFQKQGFTILSSELTSQTFGASTKTAAIGFQEKYASEILYPLGLTYGTGKVAGSTRSKLNQLYGCGSSIAPPITPPATCTPNWQCGSWSTCYNSQQTKTCTDYNYCGVTTGRPALTQSCTSTSVCAPNWQTGTWSACANNQQTRTATDLNDCGVSTGLPALTQSCISTLNCTPNWSCGSWSACSYSQQTRTCTDYNYCGIITNKPVETQSCTICTPNWQTGAWSACSNSLQTRTVTDSNNCGITTNQPATTQSCCASIWQTGAWSVCADNIQTRTVTDLNNCETPTNAPVATQSCDSTPPFISSVFFANPTGTLGVNGDVITITFNEPIDPTSINPALTKGGSVSNISSSTIGGFNPVPNNGWTTAYGSVNVNIPNIFSWSAYAFTCDGVGWNIGNRNCIAPVYTSNLSLNSAGTILTITIVQTSGSTIAIGNAGYSYRAITQFGGTIRDLIGNVMLNKASGPVPSGTF